MMKHEKMFTIAIIREMLIQITVKKFHTPIKMSKILKYKRMDQCQREYGEMELSYLADGSENRPCRNYLMLSIELPHARGQRGG